MENFRIDVFQGMIKRMYKMKCIFLILFGFALWGCNGSQNPTGQTTYGPSVENYNVSKKNRQQVIRETICFEKVESHNGVSLGEFSDQISELQCSDRCPVKNQASLEISGSERNNGFLSFPNFAYNKIGRCRGHAIVSQQFNSLGVYCNYDQKIKKDCETQESFICRRVRICESDPDYDKHRSCNPDNLTSDCEKFYSEIIKDVTNNKLRAIPGFANLADFSAHPSFQHKFKDAVKVISSSYDVVDSYKEQVTGNPDLDTFLELKRRVDMGFNPYVAVAGGSLGSHAVTVYDTKEIDGETVLCARDSNKVRETKSPVGILLDQCQNYISLKKGKPASYHNNGQIDRLYHFSFFSDEDNRMQKYRNEYASVCKRIYASKNLCLLDDAGDNITYERDS